MEVFDESDLDSCVCDPLGEVLLETSDGTKFYNSFTNRISGVTFDRGDCVKVDLEVTFSI